MVVGVGADVLRQLGRRHLDREHARLVRSAFLAHQLRTPSDDLERVIDAEDVSSDQSRVLSETVRTLSENSIKRTSI